MKRKGKKSGFKKQKKKKKDDLWIHNKHNIRIFFCEIVEQKKTNEQQQQQQQQTTTTTPSHHSPHYQEKKIISKPLSKKKQNLIQSIDFSPVLPIPTAFSSDEEYLQQLKKEYRNLSINLWTKIYLFEIKK